MPRKPQRIRAVPRADGGGAMATAVAERKRPRPPRAPQGTTADPPRSVRVSDTVWDRAKAKAERNGMTPSYVIQTLLDAYGQDKIEMPTVVLHFGPPGESG